MPNTPIRMGIAFAAAVLTLSSCTFTNGGVEQKTYRGFSYLDYPGSPYDQISVPDEAINQIQCPPPARPHCGDR